jgi:DNA-binding XRE family transcriptional regulator
MDRPMTTQASSNAACSTSVESGLVVEAGFFALDSILHVRFEDGVERAVRWGELPFATHLGFVPVGAAPGHGGESLVLVDATGREVTLSAESMRAALDEEYRARVCAQDESERGIVGTRLRTVRRTMDLSQLQLSRRSGIPQESLSRIENGRRDPRLGTLQRLARGFGLTLDQLMERLSVDG